jgi:hypothetical protein
MSSYYGTVNSCPSTIGPCPGQSAEAMASSAVPACTLTGGSCGSSVMLSAGAFSFRLNLLSISAINGVSWTFGLDYLAGNGINDILGIGFNYTQNLRLVPISGGVQLASGGNTLDTFVTTDGGVTYTADEYNCTQAELTRGGSGATDTFTLSASDGTVSQFAGFDSGVTAPGRLLSVKDRYGNTQTYSWTNTAGTSQLTSITDSYGRVINFLYYGPEFNYCLQQITDFLGRQLNFQFDNLGHLVAVVTPSINNAATGNTFPGGTAYVFQYDVDNPRPQRQYDLIKIFYPNQATPFIDAATLPARREPLRVCWRVVERARRPLGTRVVRLRERRASRGRWCRPGQRRFRMLASLFRLGLVLDGDRVRAQGYYGPERRQ